MLVCDTSVLVGYLRGDEDARRMLHQHETEGPLMVPTLVVWELWKGAHTRHRRASLDHMFGSLQPLPLTAAVARIAGDIHRTLRRDGANKPAIDLLIAAHAIEHDAPLASLDRDFDGIPGLDLHLP